MCSWVELDATSAFSFLRGGMQPEALVSRAASLGYESVALLDHDGLYGAPRFFAAARDAGLRPLVGAKVQFEAEGARGPLGLLVRTREGYQNLCMLLTEAHLAQGKHLVRERGLTVGASLLGRYRAGLTALLLAHEEPLRSLARGPCEASRWAEAVVRLFGREDTYAQQLRHFTRRGLRTARRLRALAEHLGLRSVASNAPRYTEPAGGALVDVLDCLRYGTTLERAGRRLAPNRERWLKPPASLRALFAEEPALCDHARALGERCEFTLADLGYRFPEYPLPQGESPTSLLRYLVRLGARDRYGLHHAKANAQLEHELALIEKLGLEGYFLIVWDLVRFCRERGLLVQGRGSAANSAVCYALGLTAVDPVGMELLFERFLSEERGEWPDIDLDLPAGEDRERVIQYVYHRYGPRGAAMTANVITYRARSAAREAGKALGLPLETLDRLSRQLHWAKLDPEGLAARARDAGLDVRDGRLALWLELTCAMQDLPRHLGQHPGGMIIAAGRLDAIAPLEPAAMPGRVVLQWDKDDGAELGLLKVDLLGLGMMALLQDAVPLVATHDGVDLDLAHLPADDPATYAMLRAADTVGVFQVESRAQMATLPRLAPEKFYDLVVEVALIRPGPIVGQMVHPYLERRAGRAPVTYPHPELEAILARTLGVPLFQEQLMRVAMTAAGFTGGEAEQLRRAMGSKRSVEKMRAMEDRLRQGMRSRGYPRDAEDHVVQGIAGFALYGFPESHAASFALLAYASAYLKRHFPASFTCALLNRWPMGFYHPATVLKDAQRHGVRAYPLEVLRSRWECTREGEGVRLGLRYVQGLREQVAQRWLARRGERERWTLAAFARASGASERELGTLAELGALAALDGAPEGARWTRRTALWQVGSLGSLAGSPLLERTEPEAERAPLPEMTLAERVAADYRGSGLTVGPHPLRMVRASLAERGVHTVAAVNAAQDGAWVRVAGIVITRQRPGTAKGFFFLTLEDETGLCNAIVTPRLFEEQRALLVGEPALELRGVLQRQRGAVSLKVHSAHAVEAFAQREQSAPVPPSRDFH